MKKIKKAIIPSAGLGTRFLPATKTVPKEMLTIVDAPIILYVIEEALAAGIEDIVLVQGRGKYAIEDFFDTSYELEDKLNRDGKSALLSRVAAVRDHANIVSIRQKHALGLGHAVFCAKPIVGEEPFAVLLGDEITVGQNGSKNVTALLTGSFVETGVSAVAVMAVSDSDVNKYGIVEGSELRPGFFKVENLIEKPKPSQTVSRLALPGRYVFDNKIMKYLADAKPSLNGEIQLTDSMLTLCKDLGLHALTFDAQRYDAGDKLGYLIANIELALKHSDLESPLKEYIKDLARRIS